MTFIQLGEIFFLFETAALLIPYINKAVFQYTGKIWYHKMSTHNFLSNLFWIFAGGWTIAYIMHFIELAKYGGV